MGILAVTLLFLKIPSLDNPLQPKMLTATVVLYSLLFPSLGWTMPAADTHLERRGQ
jgi:hypothetical protein